MKVPFNDLEPSLRTARPGIEAALRRVLSNGRFILGPEVAAFEKEFARAAGTPYCVGTASGTDAITLALMALGIGKGGEVLTSALTAYPTITGIARSGARPVLVDVRPEDGLMDPAAAARAVTPRTKAIVPVHLYGQSCDMAPLLRLARAKNLKIVEDCAHAAGASYRGRNAGASGDCGAFSFYPTKNLGALGDAGAVTTRHEEIYRRLLRLRDYGRAGGNFVEPGINSRLDEMQAAILRVKLRRLKGWVRERRRLAQMYRDRLPPEICFEEHEDRRQAYYVFAVKVPRRAKIIRALKSRGIAALVHFPRPVFREKAFAWPAAGRFPHASRLAREVLSLPFFPGMTQAQVLYTVRCLNESLGR
ncbi:MAG TPA: DegT/DnrJ/EryC1/StrS family aminotransferase [Verrucomicrobiae bacterium]|jgi:dTDP-3-amino-3,4,6-trideoxy-alpha-D-glucose transaminase|nr:DegT/DnrJ/EryC1/StrS family aminotransferase [Verrucomicrobiae bacterium]